MAKKKVKSKPKKVATPKSLGGRPLAYSSGEEFEARVHEYMRSCMSKSGKKLVRMPNKAGLCLFLGISRDTYNEYKKRFPDALNTSEKLIEDEWVQRLKSSSPIGAIFYLKNAFKEIYKDRQETDVTSKGKALQGNAITFANFKDATNSQ